MKFPNIIINHAAKVNEIYLIKVKKDFQLWFEAQEEK